jgi:hypothetical protein
MRCYTWDRKCIVLPDVCADNLAASSNCGPTQLWFWVLAAAGAVALITKGKK